MKILTALTYYRPHTSGLTIYAERLARALARRGHDVTVLTMQYDRSLPREETADGVRVVRVPVVARVSKGVLAPSFGWVATRLVRAHDVVHVHLPQFDAPGVALRARLFGKPAVLTYHCDLRLPPGLFNRAVNLVVRAQNNLAACLVHRLVTYTRDYAEASRYLRRYSSRVTAILPPVELLPAPEAGAAALGAADRLAERRPVIGVAARFAADKGIEVLLEALPAVLARHPRAVVLFAGEHSNVMGEQAYAARLMPRIREFERLGHWLFLGNLDQPAMAAFYRQLDVLTLPSLNATESFGLVQIEAMLCGVPVVASALPGVRQPVTMHGMGRIARIGDAAHLAEQLLDVLSRPAAFAGDVDAIRSRYAPDRIAEEYERLFTDLLERRGA
jgi:glycosyltransferase involved in cell wall biosynthesis